jgi:hypothetical protein
MRRTAMACKTPLAELVETLDRQVKEATAEIDRAESPGHASATVTYRLGMKHALYQAKAALELENQLRNGAA